MGQNTDRDKEWRAENRKEVSFTSQVAVSHAIQVHFTDINDVAELAT